MTKPTLLPRVLKRLFWINGCLEWTGGMNSNGYPTFRINNKNNNLVHGTPAQRTKTYMRNQNPKGSICANF